MDYALHLLFDGTGNLAAYSAAHVLLVDLVLQVAVVEWSFLNLSFGTTPLTSGQWAWCLTISSTVLWSSELRKWSLRRWHSTSGVRKA